MDNQNPFMHIVDAFNAQHQQGGQPGDSVASSALGQAQDATQGGTPPSMPGQGGQGMTPDAQASDLEAGNIQGVTPSIMNAIKSINDVIKQSQDRDTIMVMRSIVSLLSRFVTEDQETQTEQLKGGPEEGTEQTPGQSQSSQPQGGMPQLGGQ